MAIDDSPSRRFGRCVEAANVHHNPTPGPADSPWLYMMRIDIPELQSKCAVRFCTKHELARSPLVPSTIRVVLLEHSKGNWTAYLSTDPSMSPE
ncbi:MAG: hypothetical protein U1A77_25840 [Pirellulales bacterium]